MSLTESKLKDLRDKKFDSLYEKDKVGWNKITDNAYIYARDNICQGTEPRQDDVLQTLAPILEVNEKLRKHQEINKARYKHYRSTFAEFLIDQYYRDAGKD